MHNHPLKFLLLCAALAAPGAMGQASNLQVQDAWARQAPMMDAKGNGAVYAMLVNTGSSPDALVGGESDVARTVEVHETYRSMGMMMMRPVRRIEVPAGGKAELKPGGYHVMLIGLKRDLKAGETISLTLEFEKAGKRPVTATVR